MDYKHPVDRMAVKLRPVLAVLAVLAFPVFLFSYAKMIALAYYAWPGWLFAIALGSHLVGWLGLSALFDIQQERQSKTQGAQSAAPRRS